MDLFVKEADVKDYLKRIEGATEQVGSRSLNLYKCGSRFCGFKCQVAVINLKLHPSHLCLYVSERVGQASVRLHPPRRVHDPPCQTVRRVRGGDLGNVLPQQEDHQDTCQGIRRGLRLSWWQVWCGQSWTLASANKHSKVFYFKFLYFTSKNFKSLTQNTVL